MAKQLKIKVRIPKITKKDIDKEMKKRFNQKWRDFIAFEGLQFHNCFIRYLREEDNLMLLMSDQIPGDYIQIRFNDDKKFKKIIELFKDDKEIQISLKKNKKNGK